jgi:hypothetical protein
VLCAPDGRYLVPPGIDLFELGVIDMPGRYELLPIDENEKPLWNGVVHLLVTEAQAKRQRKLVLRAYRTLHAMIREAEELASSVAVWSERRQTHPVFGMLRLETIEVWREHRRGTSPLGERELEALYMRVARRAAARIRAHLIR